MSKKSLAVVVALVAALGQGRAQKAPDAAVGKPVTHWIGLLKDDNPLLREEAAA